MVWAAFSRNGTGPITQIKGIMDSVMYRDILANHLEDAADGLPLSVQNCWEFQQDNDPKHTSRLVKSWLNDNKIRTMEWPAQSPDLNPIENLWNRVEWDIRKQKPATLDDLYHTIKESCHIIDLPEAGGQHASPLRCCLKSPWLPTQVLK